MEAPTLKSVIETTAQKGREGRREQISSFREKLSQAKEGAKSAFLKSKDVIGKVGRAVETTEAVARGLTSTEGQTALMLFLEKKLIDSGDKLSEKFSDIRQGIKDKKDQAIGSFKERMRSVWLGVKEKVITPTVDRAKAIRDKVVQGAKDGTMFTKKVIESGASKVVSTEAKAMEWGVNLVRFSYRQGESLINESRARVSEISASWDERQALKSQTKGERTKSIAEKLSQQANRAYESARVRREKALTRRQAAQNLRSGRLRTT